jgi:amino acid transporter
VFFDFNASDFLVAYINIPLFAILYVGWKVYRRTKVWKPAEMDFVTVRAALFELVLCVAPVC